MPRKLFKWTENNCDCYIDVSNIIAMCEQENGSWLAYTKGDGDSCYSLPYNEGLKLLEVWKHYF